MELDTILLNTPDDLRYSIAANLINSGKPYEVWYQHGSWLGNTMPSISLVLDVDYQAPNRNQTGAPAVLPDDVASGGLTLEYLDTHPFLEITVPRSSDILAGDTVTISWVPVVARSFRQDFTPITSKVVTVPEVMSGVDPVVRIDAALIKGLVQGKIGIYYRYIDRTGNMGQFSPATVLQVDLTPAPDNLQAPRVFLAEGDGIDRADAQLGVEVEIPEPIYDNPQPDDQIQVIWEGTPVPAVTLDTLPMYIPIDWPTLSANGPLDKRSFKVSYNVVRGALSTPSPDLDVTVDFTVAGPAPDPLTPGPINAALPAIVVKSREVPPLDNVLGNADKGKDATAELAINPFAIGDTLRLYWGDLRPHVAELIIAATGTAIQFVIPWDVIKRGGYNDRLPVYYSTWNGVNEQESEHIEVDVRIVDITGLPEVGFPDRFVPPAGPTPVPIINCWRFQRLSATPGY
ncbi:Phenylalanyl-tRNA synthetase beta subunit [Pseudomonas syringae pv. actinidiae]|uniref:Phenylalanyl-tRNA synthetase beta subunit n=2 Tax=Pseudomonas syringae pv. actinidiae TaxID=103796 RepID=A0A2V0QQU0_PSESF|nr:Phenylalanyl-tRNA synthetase beta subunit [Pseudomonas syringae pv. actinidiae]